MLLKCISMMYSPGSHQTVYGINRSHQDTVVDGVRFHNRGTGYGEVVVASKFVLDTRNGKTTESFNVISFFQENWGKMSEKRRKAIIATMPRQIEKDEKGLSEKDLIAWLERAELHHKTL